MSNDIYHFGIRGMRWGVRRRRPDSADHTRTAEIRKHTPRELSNAELQTAITRMQLEKQYKELSKKKISIGQGYAGKFLASQGKEMMNDYAKEHRKEIMQFLVGMAKNMTGGKVG